MFNDTKAFRDARRVCRLRFLSDSIFHGNPRARNPLIRYIGIVSSNVSNDRREEKILATVNSQRHRIVELFELRSCGLRKQLYRYYGFILG